MSPTAPPRVLLRPLEEDDLPFLLRIFTDPASLPHWPRALTEAEVRALLERHRALARSPGLGLRAIVRAADGAFMGDCGVSPLALEGRDGMELAYHLLPEHRGRGYATEAARLALAEARAAGVGRVVMLVLPENLPSRRVAERLGARREGETTWAGARHLVYALAP